jgi:hypothetical protein
MNGRVLAALFFWTVVTAAAANGQAIYRPTPAPEVTAVLESWYVNGEALIYGGNVYYPAGPKVHFVPHEMVETGSYRGIPLYSKTTLEPMSVVFVPVGRGLLQPYERRRAGTVGSQTPSFPVVRTGPEPVGTTGGGGTDSRVLFLEEPPPDVAAEVPPAAAPWRDPREPKEPGPRDGIFITFEGVRYYSEGPPAKLDPALLIQAGEHLGWPVYRQRGDASLYVPVTKEPDAPLARYRRR